MESYILYNKKENERKSSSSGGISTLLMQYTLQKHGIVYGACYNDKLEVVHKRATTLEECEKFKTSKYVRSNIENIYIQVIEDLKNDNLVLFTGTPCQIAGLKSVTQTKLQKNLILCEIMCDTVASPLLFEKFKKELERKYNKKVTNINFRYKTNDIKTRYMKIDFENKESVILPLNKNNLFSEYMHIFGCGLSAPQSCSNCEFEHTEDRTSDFTIGDFYGNKKTIEKSLNGISMMLINTEKAKELFDTYLKDKVIYRRVDPLEALANNHIEPKKNILNKEIFIKELEKSSFNDLARKYVRKYRWRTKLGKLVPKHLKENIKNIIKR